MSSEYEAAMKRWSVLCYQKLPVIPPHAKQLKELIPIQKKEETIESDGRNNAEDSKSDQKDQASKCITGLTYVPFFPVISHTLTLNNSK
jgi:hypothetical protein